VETSNLTYVHYGLHHHPLVLSPDESWFGDQTIITIRIIIICDYLCTSLPLDSECGWQLPCPQAEPAAASSKLEPSPAAAAHVSSLTERGHAHRTESTHNKTVNQNECINTVVRNEFLLLLSHLPEDKPDNNAPRRATPRHAIVAFHNSLICVYIYKYI
jgi:hypothetical protein